MKNMLKEGMDINARAKGCTCCVVGRGVAGGRCGGLGGGVAGRRGGGERRGRRQAHDDDTRLTHASHSLTRTRAHTHTHARAHTHRHTRTRTRSCGAPPRTSEARRLLGRPYGGGLPCTSRAGAPTSRSTTSSSSSRQLSTSSTCAMHVPVGGDELTVDQP